MNGFWKVQRGILLVSMLLITLVGNAQSNTHNSWEEVIEELSIADEEGEVSDWENELEELTGLMNNPVNINSATKQQLEQFPFLSDLQIENLLAYVYIHGEMQTVYELQLVEAMDWKTIQYLLPFICVQPVHKKEPLPTFRQIFNYGKHEVITRFDLPLYTRKGYETGKYLGPSVYNSVRYGFHYRDKLYAGVTAEKDAGEPLGALHNKKGYDYYSFYLLLQDIGRLKTLAAGNYRLSFGQGLVLGSGSFQGKTASAFNFRSTGIRKHSSTDEYNYFRGAAAATEWKQWTLSAFYSHRSLDGMLKDDEINSIYKTGLHRSQKEADKSNLFTQQMMGGNLTYAGNHFKLGLTGIYYFFNDPYEPELKGYSKYNLHGNDFYNVSIDYKYRWHRFSVQGEAAMGKQGMAFVNQFQYSLAGSTQLMLIHRYYAHDYWAMYAHSFGESSSVQNENGWYLAVSTAPLRGWKFFASVDLFSSPWWRYRISKPSQGFDGFFQADYSPRTNVSMYVNYRYKRKERDVTGTKGEVILPTYHHRLRYRLNYLPSASVSLRTTIDYNRFHSFGKSVSQGRQFTQMVSYQLPWLPLKAEVQGSYFHTDDYDSRVYSYEKGMLYSFYTPSFQGKGFRLAAHLRYDLNKHWMTMAKIGQTLYSDLDEIGSGDDLIKGNKKADVQILLRLKF